MNRALALLAIGLGLASSGCNPFDPLDCRHDTNLYVGQVSWTGERGVTVSFSEDGEPDHPCDTSRSFDADGHPTDHYTPQIDCAAKVADCIPGTSTSSPPTTTYTLHDGSTVILVDDVTTTLEHRDAAGVPVYSETLALDHRRRWAPLSQLRGDFLYAVLLSSDLVDSVAKIDVKSGAVLWSTPVADANGIR